MKNSLLKTLSCLLGLIFVVNGAELWNPDKCEKGCRSDSQCPKNAVCRPISVNGGDKSSSGDDTASSGGDTASSGDDTASSGGRKPCGLCRCADGYEPRGNACVDSGAGSVKGKSKAKARKATTPRKGGSSEDDKSGDGDGEDGKGKGKSKGPEGRRSTISPRGKSSASKSTSSPSTPSTSTVGGTSTASTTASPTSTTTVSTSTAVPTQGPPPAAVALDCSAYDCGVDVQPANDSDPLRIRTQQVGTPPPGCKKSLLVGSVVCKTPLADGSKQCFGAYCLPFSDSKSICVCPAHKNGASCQEDKRGKCASGNGQTAASGFTINDQRFVNKNDPATGSILSRHFAANAADCIKLCQWDNSCRSVNFGKLNGQNVCELLSIEFVKGRNSALESWLQKSSGWSFICLR